MKISRRILGLLLALSLIFSTFSLFTLTAAAKTDIEDSATYAALCKIGETEEFHIEGTLTEFNGSFAMMATSFPFTVDAKGESIALEIKLSFLTVRAICLDGKMYILIPELRISAIRDYNESDDIISVFALSAVKLLDRIYNEHTYIAQDFYVGETSQSESFLGTSYAMEEIVENTPNPSFRANIYYNSSDKAIKGAILDVSGEKFTVTVSELSNEADDSAFEISTGYFDLTVIVLFFLKLFLA